VIEYQQDIKYQLTADTRWVLIEPISILHSFQNDWYGIDKDTREVWANRSCAWDGATWFPDFLWILESSLRHDVLLWLIAKGAIAESANNMIDREMSHYIKLLGGPEAQKKHKTALTNFRAWYTRKGTNLANTKLGDTMPVYRLEFGKRTRIR
jgi:hypothetical protein